MVLLATPRLEALPLHFFFGDFSYLWLEIGHEIIICGYYDLHKHTMIKWLHFYWILHFRATHTWIIFSIPPRFGRDTFRSRALPFCAGGIWLKIYDSSFPFQNSKCCFVNSMKSVSIDRNNEDELTSPFCTTILPSNRLLYNKTRDTILTSGN